VDFSRDLFTDFFLVLAVSLFCGLLVLERTSWLPGSLYMHC